MMWPSMKPLILTVKLAHVRVNHSKNARWLFFFKWFWLTAAGFFSISFLKFFFTSFDCVCTTCLISDIYFRAFLLIKSLQKVFWRVILPTGSAISCSIQMLWSVCNQKHMCTWGKTRSGFWGGLQLRGLRPESTCTSESGKKGLRLNTSHSRRRTEGGGKSS